MLTYNYEIFKIFKISENLGFWQEDMTITLWRTMQGVKDETLIATILSQVKAGELSMEKMCNEFDK